MLIESLPRWNIKVQKSVQFFTATSQGQTVASCQKLCLATSHNLAQFTHSVVVLSFLVFAPLPDYSLLECVLFSGWTTIINTVLTKRITNTVLPCCHSHTFCMLHLSLSITFFYVENTQSKENIFRNIFFFRSSFWNDIKNNVPS